MKPVVMLSLFGAAIIVTQSKRLARPSYSF
jgi:hypothetical protein